MNDSKNLIRTAASCAEFHIEEQFGGIDVFLFQEKTYRNAIRERWNIESLIKAVNTGYYSIEFITRYDSYASILYICDVICRDAPRYTRFECQLVLPVRKLLYKWNELQYDRIG